MRSLFSTLKRKYRRADQKLSAACVLLFTLGVTLFISLLVTGFFTSVFLSLRFVAQVSQSDGGMIQGVKVPHSRL